ncbi:uncharacterized protein NEMAJ01_1364 [Nematocida major]|uniref:uncharacterized protein n=1 Tax=Nematocida major TaxID=1912982 RepID=UPI0020075B6D|nr:uncharacterized protein NEMAJ01_1364 [Nematocida major]KAH9386468.1 hypothetical protein NEMAJ01_1364 [Nematocida major]
MLVINLAPIDQSGRSLAIAHYLKKEKNSVMLVSYAGTRKHGAQEKQSRLSIFYIRNIVTKGKGFPARQATLVAKMLYIVFMSIFYLFRYKYDLYKNGLKRHCAGCKFYSRGGAVIFVVPPTITVILPVIVAKLLRIRVIIDWHRIAEGFMEIMDRCIASMVENITVTQAMQEYFMQHRIKKPFLLTDMKLRKITKKKRQERKHSLNRVAFLHYLSTKYKEYGDKLGSIKSFQKIGVCSTSCSKEENIKELLKEIKSLEIPQGGVLFITTKEKINCKAGNLQVIQVFLDYQDYLGLLEIADFGISTHVCRFDFPLKIVDYLESKLLVLAHVSTPDIAGPFQKSRIVRYTDRLALREQLTRLYTEDSENEPNSPKTNYLIKAKAQ